MRIAILGGTGVFGRALAARLQALGEDVVLGSRDANRVLELATVLGVLGATNAEAVEGADLIILSVPSSAALDTARELADAIGDTPVLCVASDLRFTEKGVEPGRDSRSLAEDVAEILSGPVVSGYQSLGAATLTGPDAPDQDVFVCGDESPAKDIALDVGARLVAGYAIDAGPLANSRGLEAMTAVLLEREQALPHARRPARHGPALSELRVIPVTGLPEVREGDDLAALLAEAAQFEEGDVLVVSHKIVSKAEGRVMRGVEKLDAVLSEARRILRRRDSLVIAETRHGLVCASAGVDASNAPEPGSLVLLPLDPDASAARLHERLGVAVIISDSFGRAWRQGTTDVAIGAAGLTTLLDLRGERDATGYELEATTIAIADEIAGAAELVKGKTRGVPAAIVRGLSVGGEGTAQDLVMPAERDLFR